MEAPLTPNVLVRGAWRYWPSRDPDVPHEGKVFRDGAWRSPESYKARNDRKNARQVKDGGYYIGKTRRADTASIFNEVIRRDRHARKQQSGT